MENDRFQHHKRYEYCKTRLKYRQTKQLTAVKVYTIANESRHILIFGVPKINLHVETKRALQKYGSLKCFELITDKFAKEAATANFHLEQFTDVYHGQYDKLEGARHAKKFFDARNFYGGVVHISYAPEYETIDEVYQKLEQRQNEVSHRVRLLRNEKPKKRHLPN